MTLPALLAAQPGLWIALACVLGLLIGSFLNVVVHRLPRMMEREWQAQCAELASASGNPAEPTAKSATQAATQPSPYNLVSPRSACPNCGHAIAWFENIPLLSFAWLKGRCRACKSPIAWRYPLLEALTGLLSGLVAWRYGFTPQAFTALLLVWTLLALTFIDLDTFLLPDSLTLPLLWLGLLVNLKGLYTPLPSAVIGAVAGYLSLWTVYHAFRLLTGKEGMGYGDFKLLAALGAWFGWLMLPVIILAASLSGAFIGIAMILFAGHDRSKPIPFGPYLAMGGLIALFGGHALLQAYLGG